MKEATLEMTLKVQGGMKEDDTTNSAGSIEKEKWEGNTVKLAIDRSVTTQIISEERLALPQEDQKKQWEAYCKKISNEYDGEYAILDSWIATTRSEHDNWQNEGRKLR